MAKIDFKNNFNILKRISQSASFALLLSVAFFAYEMSSGARETKEVVKNLEKIQGSLSTRYLGLFPEYIDNINNLLNDAIENQNLSNNRDTVIIIEDVLYYGISSDPSGFRKMIENLLTLSNNGCHITIAYYDVNGRPFKQMIRDKMISSENQTLYKEDLKSYRSRMGKLRRDIETIPTDLSHDEIDKKIQNLVNTHFDNYLASSHDNTPRQTIIRNIRKYTHVDSILMQRYYEKTRDADKRSFAASVKRLLRPLPLETEARNATSLRVNKLCTELDSIKGYYLDKPYNEITYSDFYNMYKDLTLAICTVAKQQQNIELLPLNENMMMCCWMSSVNNVDKAIFAFPSKYSTDEIGFISQDIAIMHYIHTMLNGIRGDKYEEKTANSQE